MTHSLLLRPAAFLFAATLMALGWLPVITMPAAPTPGAITSVART